jgi:DNA-binding transcriptional LysR family regulator
MDRMLSMEVFVAIVDLGSFTAAANLFKITPAMVSKHISSLEKRLGSTLLARTTRRQNLTEIGQKYYENCKRILAHIADAEAGAEAMGNTPKGNLRVNASMWFGSLTLAPIVCDYLRQYPDVNIELSLTDRYVDIVDEGFDVAIRIGELQDSSLVARKLSKFEVAICASPDYLAQAGVPRKPEDLAHHQCLGFTNWQNQGGWKLMQKPLGSKALQVPRFSSDNGQALRTAATKGIGIIMMPKELLREDIEAGRLVELMKPHVPPARPIHAVYPKERQQAPKLTAFVEFLVERLHK